MAYEPVLIGRGKRIHIRYDAHYALCMSGQVDSRPTVKYPLCKACADRYLILKGQPYKTERRRPARVDSLLVAVKQRVRTLQ